MRIKKYLQFTDRLITDYPQLIHNANPLNFWSLGKNKPFLQKIYYYYYLLSLYILYLFIIIKGEVKKRCKKF